MAQPMPKVLEIVEDQLLRLGKGFREYWVISATWGLLKSKFEPDQVESVRKEAIDRIMTAYHKVLASQEKTKSNTFQGETPVESYPLSADEQVCVDSPPDRRIHFVDWLTLFTDQHDAVRCYRIRRSLWLGTRRNMGS